MNFRASASAMSHEDEVYAKLNDAAMRDALRNAKAYLPAAGVSLGRCSKSRRTTRAAPPAGLRHGRAGLRGEAAVPIAPGTLSYNSQVRVTWELVGH